MNASMLVLTFCPLQALFIGLCHDFHLSTCPRIQLNKKFSLILSYCVISSVIMYIVFWDVMLLYAMISCIVLCYLYIIPYVIPYIKSNHSLSFSLGRLLNQTYQTYQACSIPSTRTKKEEYVIESVINCSDGNKSDKR